MTFSKKLSIASTATIALTLCTVIHSGVSAASNSTSFPFKDLKEAAPWARVMIQEAQDKQLVNGDHKGMFRPLQAVTRQEAAAALAKAMDLPIGVTEVSAFSDVSKDLWSAGAIEAVRAEGWMKGDSKGNFRPKDVITREELASILARATQIEAVESQEALISSIKDANKISSWAKESVASIISTGFMTGNNGSFYPKQSVLRQELAAVLLRLDTDNRGLQTIEQVKNGKVTIGETTYSVDESLKPLFAESNAPILKNAGIRFVSKNGQITQLLDLQLETAGKAAANGQSEFSGNLVLDGGNVTIEGSLKVDADYITIQNLNIKGDLEIGERLNNDFYAKQITVKGNTYVRGGDENTVVFDQSSLEGMDVSKEGVKVEAINKTVVQDVHINSKEAGLWGDESITYQQVTIGTEANYVYLAARINNIEMNSGKERTVVSGNSVIDNVTIKGSGEVSILNKGAIGKITIDDIAVKVTLPSNVPIQSIVLPPGVTPEQVIKNYDAVKSQIQMINNAANPAYVSGTSTGNPSNGGGSGAGSDGGGSSTGPVSPPPITNPTIPNPIRFNSYENRKPSEADVVVTAEKTGTIYYVAIPSDKDFIIPSVDQIKSGSVPGIDSVIKGNFSVTANQRTVYKLDRLQEEKGYRVWAFFKDSDTGVESRLIHLTYVLNYLPNTDYVLPFQKEDLSQIRIQFTAKLDSSITNTLDPSALFKDGRLRNYGFGYIPITSINWDLTIPDMPILSMHFNPITLGNGKSHMLDWSYVEDVLYIMVTSPDGATYKQGFGRYAQYGGEDVVSLITTQLAIEAGVVEDPSRADDVLHVLRAYPSPLSQELGLIEFNARAYQKALAEAGKYTTYADVKQIIAAVNEKYPAPSEDESNAIRAVNYASEARYMESSIMVNASLLNIDRTKYEQLHEIIRREIAQSMIEQRSFDPLKKYSSIKEIKEAYEQAYQAVSMVPTNIHFVDSDNRAGMVGGEIRWTTGTEESSVDRYELLWGADGQPTSTITTLDKQAGNTYLLPQGTMIPAGATQLFIRAILQDGTSTTAIYTDVKDTLPLAPDKPVISKDDKRNILIGADASMEFSVDYEITWIPYDEQNPPLFPGDVTVRVRVQADPVNQVPPGRVTIVSFVDNVYMYVGINDVSNTFETTYISSAMEYSADDGATWTTYDELNPPEFPGDLIIQLRERGGQYLPPGATKSFTFTSKVHMQFTGGDYLMTSSKGAEYSLNGGAWISLPFDQQVKFKPGDVVEVREAARGVFPAGAIETYTF